jgi:hypothetical protein
MSRDVTREKPNGPITEVIWSGAPTCLDMARPYLARWALKLTVWRMQLPPVAAFDWKSEQPKGQYAYCETGIGSTAGFLDAIAGWREQFEKQMAGQNPAWLCWRVRPEIHFDLNLQPSSGWVVYSRCYFPMREA